MPSKDEQEADLIFDEAACGRSVFRPFNPGTAHER